jgi:hypothetical protein
MKKDQCKRKGNHRIHSKRKHNCLLLLREWSKIWQRQFNDLGYSTVDAAITLPSLEQDKEPLSTCYQGNQHLIRSLC